MIAAMREDAEKSERDGSAEPTSERWSTRSLYWMALLAAVGLSVCFPVVGPAPRWLTVTAFVGAAPLLVALVGRATTRRRYLWESWLLGWCFGTAWYGINCYWIYVTMKVYGKLPPVVSGTILLLFSAGMGSCYGLFGLTLGYLRRRSGGIVEPLVAAPMVWVAVDLWSQYIWSTPWDQLGYSQVDNTILTQLAPWTGVHGITLVLIALNALLAAGVLLRRSGGWRLIIVGLVISAGLFVKGRSSRVAAPTGATAVLLQENIDVQQREDWGGMVPDAASGRSMTRWDAKTRSFLEASGHNCTGYIAGMPVDGAALVTPACANRQADVVVWPEAPTPLREEAVSSRVLMRNLTLGTGAGAIVGNVASERRDGQIELYNAASVFSLDGELLGRYAKIHLVPWGEYIPYTRVLGFIRGITPNAGRFTRGRERSVFVLDGHRYGVFICYESIFADEVRQFAKHGAEVLVNITDDAWYGNTSAPWQHLNMARMRAIENRRWLLCDSNTGITAAIDPWGRLTQSAPRQVLTSLAVQYGFRNDLTFYTMHGDVFGYLCALISLGVVLWSGARGRKANQDA